MPLLPVEGHKGLYRDTDSNGIVQIDDEEYELFQKTKAKKALEIQKHKQMQDQINSMRKEIDELKALMALIRTHQFIK